MSNTTGDVDMDGGVKDKPPASDVLNGIMTYLRSNGLVESEQTLTKELAKLYPPGRAPAGTSTHSTESIMSEFANLLAHVDTQLDYLQAEFSLLLFPIFAHSYIKLILEGHNQLANAFMEAYAIRIPAPYEEEVKALYHLKNMEQALASNVVRTLLNNKFTVRLSKQCLKHMDPILSRLPNLSIIMKERLDIESAENSGKQRNILQWQMGGVMGQLSRNESKRLKMYYGMTREECFYPIDKRRTRTKEDAKKRELNAPTPDRIPMPPITEMLKIERAKALRDSSKNLALLGPDLPPSVCFYTAMNAHGGVCSCDVSEDSGQLAVGYGDSGISVFPLNDARVLRKLRPADDLERLDQESDEIHEEMLESDSPAVLSLMAHSGPVYSLNFSPDKRLLLSSSGDRTIRLWSMQTQSNVVVIRTGAPVWQATFCQRGFYYATASANNTAAIWSTDRINPLRVYADALSQVSSVDYHPNCNYIVGGSDDKYVRIWDVLSGACVRTFAGHRAAVRNVKFSPCGRFVTSVSADGVVVVWDVASSRMYGADTREFPTRIPSVAWSRDGGVFALSRGGAELSLYSLDTLVIAHTQTHAQGDYSNDPKIDYPNFETHSYTTKDTPVVGLHFSRRNLLVGVGAYNQ